MEGLFLEKRAAENGVRLKARGCAEPRARGRKHMLRLAMPAVSCVLAVIPDIVLPDAENLVNVAAPQPLFRCFLSALAVIFAICMVRALYRAEYRVRYLAKAPFYAVLVLVLNLISIATKKCSFLPALYFPTFDRIFNVFVDEAMVLLKCTGYSLRLLLYGISIGGLSGFLTGILIGWNKKANYWLFPVIRFIGPIPTTIWIPLAMLFFPTLFQGAVFIVALSMWFPMAFLTSAGIQSVRKSLFEAGMTLGAGRLYQIVHIAVPAAMPNVFVGIFMGTVSSLISLISAELIGARYGLGWYINWQQQVMNYPQVYAGFLVIALLCFVIFKAVFGIRNRVLFWQKGIVRW